MQHARERLLVQWYQRQAGAHLRYSEAYEQVRKPSQPSQVDCVQHRLPSCELLHKLGDVPQPRILDQATHFPAWPVVRVQRIERHRDLLVDPRSKGLSHSAKPHTR